VGVVGADALRNRRDSSGRDQEEHSRHAGNFGRRVVAFDVLLIGFSVGGSGRMDPKFSLNNEKDER